MRDSREKCGKHSFLGIMGQNGPFSGVFGKKDYFSQFLFQCMHLQENCKLWTNKGTKWSDLKSNLF